MLRISLAWTWKQFMPSSVLCYIAAVLTTCYGQLNDDNHYSEEDDAQVLPIVLPIVLVVVIVCIVACCWQGKKCPCNKDDNKKKNKQESEDAENAENADKVFVENEKSKASNMSSLAGRQAVMERSKPPKYSTSSHTTTVNSRQKDLPGRTYVHREQTSLPANKSFTQQSRKQQAHSQVPRSHTTSGYETGENTSGRKVDEKYKVVDNRSYNRESRSRYGRENDGFVADAAGDKYLHKHDQYYRGDQRNGHY